MGTIDILCCFPSIKHGKPKTDYAKHTAFCLRSQACCIQVPFYSFLIASRIITLENLLLTQHKSEPCCQELREKLFQKPKHKV